MKFINNQFETLIEKKILLREYPKCKLTDTFKNALDQMNSYGLGFCIIGDLAEGILTDGDIRRLISKGDKPFFALCNEYLEKIATFPSIKMSTSDGFSTLEANIKAGITYIPIKNNLTNEIYILDVKRFTLH